MVAAKAVSVPHESPATAAPEARGQRMPQLDGLRGLAAVAVIFSHTAPVGIVDPTVVGGMAVRLFFVLSGFLITGILLRARDDARRSGTTNGQVMQAFYIRRSLRIFPVYYLAALLAWKIGIDGVEEELPWVLTYLTNVHLAWDRNWHGGTQHLWSLAVEEQFYLIWPFLILYMPRRWVPHMLVAVVVLSPAWRLFAIVQTESTLRAVLPLPGCVDTLGIGALLAWLWTQPALKWERFRWWIVAAGGLAFLASLSDVKIIAVTLRDTASALMFMPLVDRVARGIPGMLGSVLQSSPMVYLGTLSYGLYLFHPFIQDVLGWHDRAWIEFPALLVVTVAVASVSWFGFERPLNALKDQFLYVPKNPARA